jgi:hypothetical protein
MERKNSSFTDAGADDKIEFPWQNNQVPGYGERLQRMVSKNFDESKKCVHPIHPLHDNTIACGEPARCDFKHRY